MFKKIRKKVKIPMKYWVYIPSIIKPLFPTKIFKRNDQELCSLLCRLLQKKKLDFIVIGANDGLSFDNLIPKLLDFFYEKQIYGKSFFIEPLPLYYRKLVENLSKYNDYGKVAIPYNFAIHTTKKEEIIYMVNPDYIKEQNLPFWLTGSSSFSKENLLRHNIPELNLVELTVPCLNIDELFDKIKKDEDKNSNEFGYLQIDTEGFDDKILRMIDFEKWKVSVIKYEKVHLSKDEYQNLTNYLSQYYHIFNFSEDDVCVRKNN